MPHGHLQALSRPCALSACSVLRTVVGSDHCVYSVSHPVFAFPSHSLPLHSNPGLLLAITRPIATVALAAEDAVCSSTR